MKLEASERMKEQCREQICGINNRLTLLMSFKNCLMSRTKIVTQSDFFKTRIFKSGEGKKTKMEVSARRL